MHLRRLSLFSLGLLLAPLQVAAHDTLPRDWCLDPGQLPSVIGSFQFGEADLAHRVQELEKGHEHPPAGASSADLSIRCGIVDRWSGGDLAAHGYCLELSPDAFPIIQGPASYLDARHHELYKFSHGLKGMCVVCE